VQPFAVGGESAVANIELRCRAHNQYEAELFFSEPMLARERPAAFHDGNSVWTELATAIQSAQKRCEGRNSPHRF
jgi:hypothetical protein